MVQSFSASYYDCNSTITQWTNKKYIFQPARMDYRWILKSLGGTPRQSSRKRLIDIVGEASYLIADKRYDAEHIRICVNNKNMIPIIPLRSNSKGSNKEFDKLARNCKSMIRMACIFISCKAQWGNTLNSQIHNLYREFHTVSLTNDYFVI